MGLPVVRLEQRKAFNDPLPLSKLERDSYEATKRRSELVGWTLMVLDSLPLIHRRFRTTIAGQK